MSVVSWLKTALGETPTEKKGQTKSGGTRTLKRTHTVAKQVKRERTD